MSNNLPAKIAPEEMIIRVRGHAVILDTDLAKLYEIPTKRLNERVKRNPERFPEHFMFQLTNQEWKNLRSQIATSSFHGGRRYMPYVFTEHGVLMAANVLNSGNAIKTSVALVDAFVKLRRMALSVDGLARKLNTLESKYDKQFSAIFTAIRQLMSAPPAGKKIKGFKKD